MTIGYWSDLTVEDFRALDTGRAIAVLPVGATEQHGPHLPLSVDSDLASGVLARAMPKIDPDLTVLVLPLQPIGRSVEHEAFPGTLSLSAETLIRLWMDIGEGVAKAGIRKFVIFNGHGGNVSTMDIVARDLRARFGMLTAHTSWFTLAEQDKHLDLHELTHGIHGGHAETAAMLALAEDRVRMDKAQNFPSKGEDWAKENRFVGVGGKPVKLGWLMQDLNADGASGNAAAATAETGSALLDKAAENFAAFLSEFDRIAP
ncbi:creatininase family protein [Rhodospirillaceae bacterium KN72]|uniref:Creatininase family protein n=1 Tax=Pacificispira spongiicola TaxID=2729598 RepID=A0A7Y0HF55_9PROT|nr:creatininase family protein [Pacificispira spongiicola]NMM42879.1 creatininase family protein [Pacificispira spongiicola]